MILWSVRHAGSPESVDGLTMIIKTTLALKTKIAIPPPAELVAVYSNALSPMPFTAFALETPY